MAVSTIDTCAPAGGDSWLLVLGRTAAAVFGLTAAFLTVADQQTLYKSVLPSGEVVYADSPQPGAKLTDKLSVEPHPPDPQATQAAVRDLAAVQEKLLRNADARSARLKQLDMYIVDISGQLQDAKARQKQGREVQEGDRQGRRLLGSFWQRQQMLENEVRRAQESLNGLYKERAALQ
ncbi:hypothetical protein D9M73_91270 [compost metagenome]